MRRLRRANTIWALVAAAVSLAGCGTLTRTATLNQVTRSPGPPAAVTVQQRLATHGFPNAKVSCSRLLIVNVGSTTTCSLAGAGANKLVRFTFNNKSGEVKLSSVKAIP